MKNLKTAQKDHVSLLEKMGVSYAVLKRGVLVVLMAIILQLFLK